MFKRDAYLQQLIEGMGNGLVKVITGVRRSGKSFLLNTIFADYLRRQGVSEDRIIKFAFDSEVDISLLDSYLPEQPTIIKEGSAGLINNRKFIRYIQGKTKGDGTYYLLFDEIQNLDAFVRVLNGLLSHANFDIYVTGSNSRLLSSQVDTEFSGRGDRIHLLPLSFSEFLTGTDLDANKAYYEYIRYGGIPLVQVQKSDASKSKQAVSIWADTYVKDVKNRHPNISTNSLDETLRAVAAMISIPVNPTKIENTFGSVYGHRLTNDAIANYIQWFEEAYLLKKAFRYDIKGRKYIGSPYKLYFEDIGIRNAILNFRDIDETDLIENVVFNELRYRGFNVDVGVVTVKARTDRRDKNGKIIYESKGTEVDFVANKGEKTYYVQVALRIDTSEKKEQEYESIRHIPDSFKKIIVVKEEGKPYYTSEGFLRISLLDFLTRPDAMDI